MVSKMRRAMVSVERATGWSRQLRLPPLRPIAYVVLKAMVAMLLGALALLACYSFGALTGKARLHQHMPGTRTEAERDPVKARVATDDGVLRTEDPGVL